MANPCSPPISLKRLRQLDWVPVVNTEVAHRGTGGSERDRGLRAGPTSAEQARIKALERENRELRQANEILRKASAYFALAELDRRSKP
jgi:transposase